MRTRDCSMLPNNVECILEHANRTRSYDLARAASEYRLVSLALASGSPARRHVALAYTRALTSAEWRSAFEARSAGGGWFVPDDAAGDGKSGDPGDGSRCRIARDDLGAGPRAHDVEHKVGEAPGAAGDAFDDAEDVAELLVQESGGVLIPRSVARMVLQVRCRALAHARAKRRACFTCTLANACVHLCAPRRGRMCICTRAREAAGLQLARTVHSSCRDALRAPCH